MATASIGIGATNGFGCRAVLVEQTQEFLRGPLRTVQAIGSCEHLPEPRHVCFYCLSLPDQLRERRHVAPCQPFDPDPLDSVPPDQFSEFLNLLFLDRLDIVQVLSVKPVDFFFGVRSLGPQIGRRQFLER